MCVLSAYISIARGCVKSKVACFWNSLLIFIHYSKNLIVSFQNKSPKSEGTKPEDALAVLQKYINKFGLHISNNSAISF